ncbi:hypothetical protein [Plebeiibacterium sediminum]|uniref:Uncharacterized protein n=1 Tax=Plebeiibacterium sediminum TaxID=2992112 RepID=A0AAE3SG55_9BACT|nr:hypothetical protein [Plebeiobacterium sediminum]MCW3788128.1 hypothetical protein [Plebeiobacterium sediminum]
MKNIHLLLILTVSILLGCKDDDCGECFTPPKNFIFEIVDKTSGENLFTNNTFDPENLTITNALKNNEPIDYMFISEDNINLIQIGSIGWETEIVNLNISISDQQIFSFYVDAERKMGECCSYTKYNEISVENSAFEYDTQTAIYKIFVE